MPIDHTDPADDPDPPGPPDVPRRPDEIPPPSAPADREAIHRNYQALVRRVYGAHPEGTPGGTPADAVSTVWAQAVPSLRAAWEKHEEQYPERARPAPQTYPDGSWTSGDTRRLTPDQNNEATKACADIHDEGERSILPAMRRIEAANPNRHLSGLEHMLKGTDRLKEKIAERLRYHPEMAPRQAAAEVPDAVRFTLQYSEPYYTEGVVADVERLKDAGYELLKLKNLWAKDQYKGINSQWLSPETGLRFEMQFHTAESREAKELTHKAYERLRDPLTSKAEESALEDYQRRVTTRVRVPADVFSIEDYPPEKRDG